MKRLCIAVLVLSSVLVGCGSDTADKGMATTCAHVDKTVTTLRVPSVCKKIQDAVDAAQAGDLVLVSPGVYYEGVVVETADITIRGLDRNKVILDGNPRHDDDHDKFLDNGFKVFSNGVTIENLTTRYYKGNGVFFTGTYSDDTAKNKILTGYRASYVTAYDNGDYGIYAFNATKGQFDHDLGSGHPDAGFYVGQCNPCDALLSDDISETNMLGYSGTNSTGTTIVNSVFRKNRVGIVPNSENGEKLAPNAATSIVGNSVYDNNSGDAPLTDKYAIGQGGGIVLGGTSNNVVERNRIDKQPLAGVILTDQPEGFTPKKNVVRNNVISNSGYGLVVALFTSGTGSNGNCFEGNTFEHLTGDEDFPAGLQAKAKCGGPDFDLGDMSSVITKVLKAPPNKNWWTIAAPAEQPGMPDPAKAPHPPARGPAKVDLDAIKVPAAA